jgi:hypothetical protein
VATLRYADGTAVSDAPVLFEITPALGQFAPENRAVTDAEGKAAVFLSAGTASGAATVTASYSGNSANAKIYIDVPAEPEDIVVLSLQLYDAAGEPSDKVGPDTPGKLTATLTENGVPLVNRTVVFTAERGEMVPASGTGVTDEKGQASVKLLAGTLPGTGRATARYGEESAFADYSVTGSVTDMTISLQLQDAEGKQTDRVRAGNPCRAVATLRYADGSPVSGKTVWFASSAGKILPDNAVTDAEGEATAFLFAGSEPGAGVVTVTYYTRSAAANFYTAGDEPAEIRLSLVLTETTGIYPLTRVSSDTPGYLKATLRDETGTPLSGKVIRFSVTLGKLWPASGTALTDSRGTAAILLLAGSEPGAGEAAAKFGEYSADLGFETLGDQPQDRHLSLRLLNHESGEALSRVSAASPGRLEAVLADDAGSPLAHEIVTFSTAVGELYPPDGKSLTDAEGRAYVLLLTGTEEGTGEAAAVSGDYGASLKFACAGDKPTDVRLLFFLKDSSTGYPAENISADFPGRLEAVLTDREGKPLAAQVVRFYTTRVSFILLTGPRSPTATVWHRFCCPQDPNRKKERRRLFSGKVL